MFGARGTLTRLIAASVAGLLAVCIATAAFAADYERRTVDIPMRDGVRLHTIILVPAGAHAAPILLNRTPFGAERRLKLGEGRLADAVPLLYRRPASGGYILVFQDVRGKFGSGGDYVIQRPLAGPLNPTSVDHSTDAFDTIDWLVKNTPESNGRVGMIGVSYDGFTVLMALIHPHPALMAAVPINPLVDGWMGDDWFHNGAFRQLMMSFVFFDGGPPKGGARWPAGGADDYASLLAAGSAGAYATAAGLDQSGYWSTVKAHPAYDGFWRDQALDQRLALEPHAVPTLFVASLWDQEDGYGAVHAYAAAASRPGAADKTFLVIGPWFHGQAGQDGSRTGPLAWPADTSAQFRNDMLQPFLDSRLKDGAPSADLAPVTAFETGTGAWKRYPAWPQSCASGCPSKSQALYLQPGGGLSFSPPAPGAVAWDAYVSDPANPVPYSPRPDKVVTSLGPGWPTWLLEDQRRVSGRPDVLTYVTAPLTAPLRIAGEPVVNLIAATSGTDSDWVVKLIDVYPEGAASPPGMGGYELAVGMEVFRGRYRRDPTQAEAIPADTPELYRFALPTADHVFLPGHRIMVQVQSSWFPLYDRNPQTFAANIFDARPSDYRAATQHIFHAAGQASFIDLPMVQP